MQLGHALKVCRSAKNYSLRELAVRSGFSQSYLSMLETGNRDPKLSTVEQIADALGVPFAILVFMAADTDEIRGLDEASNERLSSAVLDVLRG